MKQEKTRNPLSLKHEETFWLLCSLALAKARSKKKAWVLHREVQLMGGESLNGPKYGRKGRMGSEEVGDRTQGRRGLVEGATAVEVQEDNRNSVRSHLRDTTTGSKTTAVKQGRREREEAVQLARRPPPSEAG